jgi:hypothetical protein
MPRFSDGAGQVFDLVADGAQLLIEILDLDLVRFEAIGLAVA